MASLKTVWKIMNKIKAIPLVGHFLKCEDFLVPHYGY